MKIKKIRESIQNTPSNDDIKNIIDELKKIHALFKDKKGDMLAVLNFLSKYKSKSIKSGDQIDDSVFSLQIAKINIEESLDKIENTIETLKNYIKTGRKPLYTKENKNYKY